MMTQDLSTCIKTSRFECPKRFKQVDTQKINCTDTEVVCFPDFLHIASLTLFNDSDSSAMNWSLEITAPTKDIKGSIAVDHKINT